MKIGIARVSLVAVLTLAGAQVQAQYDRRGGPPVGYWEEPAPQYYRAPRRYDDRPPMYAYGPRARQYGYRSPPQYDGHRQRGVWTVPGQPYGRSPWWDGPNNPNGPFEVLAAAARAFFGEVVPVHRQKCGITEDYR